MNKKTEFGAREKGLLYDPIVLIRDVLRRWLIILTAVVTVAVGAYVVSDVTYDPTYQTNATLVVTTKGSASTVYTNLSSTANLATVFSEILNSNIFRQTVLADAGLSSFDGSISASVVADTNLLTVRVTADSPRDAFLVAQAILRNHEAVTYQVLGDIVLEVLQYPTVPVAPNNARNNMQLLKQTAMLAAVAMCLLLGWLSFSRDTVRSKKEARKKLDCSCLGEIPHEQKYKTWKTRIRRPKSSILITNPATGFRFSEAIHKLCRRVEQSMANGKVLMVVSLLENEGKSTVAVNLAMDLAQKHARVLLIDCDLRKPACAKLLNVNWTGSGVREVLTGRADPTELIIEDGRSGLHLLLESEGVRNTGALIGSGILGKLLLWARQNYDYVVLDLPPMSAAADAESIMEVADASLLVVRQNAAAAPALNRVISVLGRGKAKLLGCVMNNVYDSGLSSGQGQGYGGYGRYGNYGRYGRYGHYGHYGAYGSQDNRKQR